METEGTPGIPLGRSDAKIRELVKAYEQDIIECSKPPEGMITRQQAQRRKSIETLRQTSENSNNQVIPEREDGDSNKQVIANESEARDDSSKQVIVARDDSSKQVTAKESEAREPRW